MAIKLSKAFEEMAREVADRASRREDGIEVAIRDAIIVMQLVWVQLVQSSVAGKGASPWRVPGAQTPVHKKASKSRGAAGRRDKFFDKRPPAPRHSIIAQGGEIGWRAWGAIDTSLARFRLRRDAFKLRVNEIAADAFRESLK